MDLQLQQFFRTGTTRWFYESSNCRLYFPYLHGVMTSIIRGKLSRNDR